MDWISELSIVNISRSGLFPINSKHCKGKLQLNQFCPRPKNAIARDPDAVKSLTSAFRLEKPVPPAYVDAVYVATAYMIRSGQNQ